MTRQKHTDFNQLEIFGKETVKTPVEKKFAAKEREDLKAELKLETVTYSEWSRAYKKKLKEDGNLPYRMKNRFEYAALVKELSGTVDFYSVRALELVKYLDGYKGQGRLYQKLSGLDLKSVYLGWTGKEISNASGVLINDVLLHGAADEKRDAGVARTYCSIIYHACTMLALLDKLEIKDTMKLYHQRIEKREHKSRSSEFMRQDDALHNSVKSFMAACLIE